MDARYPPPPPGAERRVYVRKDLIASVEIVRGDDVVIAALLNVSLGGAFLELSIDDGVAVGMTICVHLADAEGSVEQDAKVVRVVAGPPTGCAVAWQRPTARVVALLHTMVD